MDVKQAVEKITGQRVERARSLHGGSIGDVYAVTLADGGELVAKVGTPDANLALEGYMLRYLQENSDLPVPAVHHSTDTLLLMEYIEGDSSFGTSAQQHAAELMADLHSVSAPQFGLEQDTLIGSLHQPNPWTDTWLEFFRDHRLLYMATEAHDAGRLPGRTRRRVEALAAKLEQYVIEPDAPALLHGDAWTTNILAKDGRITAFIDPAIYYGHPEIELAFTTLFNTFGDAFFRRYHEIRPIADGFFEQRRDLYNLYPLLVHVRLFGGGYVSSVERILGKLGV